MSIMEDYRLANASSTSKLISTSPIVKWTATREGFYKVNIDASVNLLDNLVGQLMAYAAKSLIVDISPQVAEAIAIKHGLELALETGLTQCVLEFDAATLVKLIKERDALSPKIGLVLQDIFSLLNNN
ncbi:hypothetical protein ACOSP7_023781 [Xanthoceras sorbifolium]